MSRTLGSSTSAPPESGSGATCDSASDGEAKKAAAPTSPAAGEPTRFDVPTVGPAAGGGPASWKTFVIGLPRPVFAAVPTALADTERVDARAFSSGAILKSWRP